MNHTDDIEDDEDHATEPDRRVTEREDCVFAALETSARLRGRDTGATANAKAMDAIDRTIATIETESARIQAHDLSAVEAVFASQALALDTLFSQLARGSMYDTKLWPEPLRLALKAQSQSRATLSTLLSLIHPRDGASRTRGSKKSREQSEGNGKYQA
jgi:hypothetical protein